MRLTYKELKNNRDYYYKLFWVVWIFSIILLFYVIFFVYKIVDYKQQLVECKEGKGIYRLEVECIKYDNDGWMNTTTTTNHVHYTKHYQTYLDLKDMVNKYEECEVRQ
ncbi:hypothetical protein LCGC14_1532830 [marine sediment metagenome]|uniref:Uncharacterized protein n=1 Tax=marine sediment metagenome TaxID=412755 RepID=A0A0F9IVJ6_9ZZZZ